MAIQTEEEGGNIQLALPPFFTTCNPVAGSHEALDGKRKSSLRLGQPFIGGAGFPSLTVGGDPLRLFVSSPPVSVNGTSNLGRGQAKARPCGSLPTVVYLRRKPKAKKANGARSFGWLVLTSFLVTSRSPIYPDDRSLQYYSREVAVLQRLQVAVRPTHTDEMTTCRTGTRTLP